VKTVVLTVDVEDYFMSPETIRVEDWDSYEDRVEVGLNVLLEKLGNNRATFFFLGHVAEKHPELVKRVAEAGHEIGTHNYWHHPYDELGPEKFREGLKRSIGILEDLVGAKIIGHRAPLWSVKSSDEWVFEALVEAGIEYDSSLFPIKTYLYGDPGANPEPHYIEAGDAKILEIPPSTHRVLGKRLPVGGGFFLRAYPSLMTHWGIKKKIEAKEPVVLYVHPWELDPGQPKLDLPFKQKLIHNIGLRGLGRKMDCLLERFQFSSIRDTLKDFEMIASLGGKDA